MNERKSLLEQAWDLAYRGDQRAVPLAEEALAAAGEKQRGAALVVSARCRWLTGDFAGAIEHAEQGIEHLEKGDADWKVRALTTLGLVCHRRAENEQAYDCYQLALDVARDSGGATAGCLSNMSTIVAERGELDTALKMLHEAIQAAGEKGSRLDEANAQSNLGIVCRELGLYDQSLEALVAAVAIYDELDCALRSGSMLGVMAGVYQKLGEHDEASRIAQRGLHLVRKYGRAYEIAFALHRLGSILAEAGEHEAALEALAEGLARSREAGAQGQQSGMKHAMAQVHRQIGNPGRAEELAREAIELARQSGNRITEAEALVGLGKVIGDVELMLEGLAILEPMDATPVLASVHLAIAEAHEASGDHRPALDHHRKFHALHRKIFNRQSDQRVRSIQVMHEVELERTRAKDAEQQVDDLLRSLPQQLLLAQEEERCAIARELHDHVSQRLTAAGLDLANVDDAQAAAVRATIKQLARDIHGLSRRIHPAIVKELGLDQALEVECNTAGRQAGWEVEVACDPAPALSEDVTIALYRIAQEAIHNAAKHADASVFRLALVVEDDALLLRIEDNGAGFDREGACGGLGLTSMAERARLCGGHLEVASEPGKGTVVEARVPLPGQLP